MRASKVLGRIIILLSCSSACFADTDPVNTILQACLPQMPVAQPMSGGSVGTADGTSTAGSDSSATYSTVHATGPIIGHFPGGSGGGNSCAISSCPSDQVQSVMTGVSTCDQYGVGSTQWAICLQSWFISDWWALASQFNLTNSTIQEFGGCENYNRMARIDYHVIASQWACLSGALNQVGSSAATSVVNAMNGSSATGFTVNRILKVLQESSASCQSNPIGGGGGPPRVWNFPGSSSSSGSVGSSSSGSGSTLPPGTVCPAWGCDGPPRIITEPITLPTATPTPTPTLTPTPIREPFPEPRPVGPEPVRGSPIYFNNDRTN